MIQTKIKNLYSKKNMIVLLICTVCTIALTIYTIYRFSVLTFTLLNSRYVGRRSRFNGANHCSVQKKAGARFNPPPHEAKAGKGAGCRDKNLP